MRDGSGPLRASSDLRDLIGPSWVPLDMKVRPILVLAIAFLMVPVIVVPEVSEAQSLDTSYMDRYSYRPHEDCWPVDVRHSQQYGHATQEGRANIDKLIRSHTGACQWHLHHNAVVPRQDQTGRQLCARGLQGITEYGNNICFYGPVAPGDKYAAGRVPTTGQPPAGCDPVNPRSTDVYAFAPLSVKRGLENQIQSAVGACVFSGTVNQNECKLFVGGRTGVKGICFYGVRGQQGQPGLNGPAPLIQHKTPAQCTPIADYKHLDTYKSMQSLTGSASQIRQRWDSMAAQSDGACVSADYHIPPPSDCLWDTKLHLWEGSISPAGGSYQPTSWLCFYQVNNLQYQSTAITGTTLENRLRAICTDPDVRKQLPGQQTIVFDLTNGPDAIVRLNNCRVTSGYFTSPPEGCVPGGSAKRYLTVWGDFQWSANRAWADGWCEMVRTPDFRSNIHECAQGALYVDGKWACFWGSRSTPMDQNDPRLYSSLHMLHLGSDWDYKVKASTEAFREVIVSGDPIQTFKRLFLAGHIAVDAKDPIKQASIRVLLSKFLDADEIMGFHAREEAPNPLFIRGQQYYITKQEGVLFHYSGAEGVYLVQDDALKGWIPPVDPKLASGAGEDLSDGVVYDIGDAVIPVGDVDSERDKLDEFAKRMWVKHSWDVEPKERDKYLGTLRERLLSNHEDIRDAAIEEAKTLNKIITEEEGERNDSGISSNAPFRDPADRVPDSLREKVDFDPEEVADRMTHSEEIDDMAWNAITLQSELQEKIDKGEIKEDDVTLPKPAGEAYIDILNADADRREQIRKALDDLRDLHGIPRWEDYREDFYREKYIRPPEIPNDQTEQTPEEPEEPEDDIDDLSEELQRFVVPTDNTPQDPRTDDYDLGRTIADQGERELQQGGLVYVDISQYRMGVLG